MKKFLKKEKTIAIFVMLLGLLNLFQKINCAKQIKEMTKIKAEKINSNRIAI